MSTSTYLPYADASLVTAATINKARGLIYSELSSVATPIDRPLHPRVQAMMAAATAAKKPATSTDAADNDTAATTTTTTTNAGPSPSSSASASTTTFSEEQKRAIQLEYIRSERVRITAVDECIAKGIVAERAAELDGMGRVLRRRRVELTREAEDVNAKRYLLQTDAVVADKVLAGLSAK